MEPVSHIDVSRAIVDHFGDRAMDPPLIPRNAHAIVLWIVDGLGWGVYQYARAQGLIPWIAEHGPVDRPVESVFPSTTAAGLPSLAFGEPPAVHGALGYSVFVPQLNRRAYLLSGDDEHGQVIAPDILYPAIVPTIFERIAARGHHSAVVSPDLFCGSGFSRWIHAGATYRGYDMDRPAQAIERVRECLAEGVSLVWLYWPYIDLAAHATGLSSAMTDSAIAMWDRAYHAALQHWSGPTPTTVMVTADHGMADLDPRRAIAHADPRMRPIWRSRWAGERRALTTELPPAEVRRLVGPSVTVVGQSDAWHDGWYGGPASRPEWHDRVLQTLILPPAGGQFEKDGIEDAAILLGGHGGNTEAERTVPLLLQSW